MKLSCLLLLSCFFNVVSAAEFEPLDVIPEDVKSITAVVPIFSQKVAFNLPTTWKAVFEDQQAGSYIIEFIPQVETIDNWNNLFTVQGFENLANQTTPIDFLNTMAFHFKEACGDYAFFEKLGLMDITGHQAFAVIMGCSNMPDANGNISEGGQSELGYYIAIKGKQDYYLVQKLLRGEIFNPDEPPVNKANAANFISDFMPIEICQAGGEAYECNK